MKALLAFVPLFQRRTGSLLLALLLSLSTLLFGVALLGTSGWFITASALTTAGLAFNLFVPSAMVRGLSFLRILSRYGERLVGHNATLKLLSDLRGWLFGALFPRLPLSDRSLRHGDLVSRLTADVDALDTAFLVAIGPLFGAIFVGAVVTVILSVLLPAAALPYGIALAIAALLVPAGLVFAGRRAGKMSVEANAEMRTGVLDGLNGLADLQLLGALGTTQKRFADATEIAGYWRRRLAGLAAGSGVLVQVMAATALIATLWAGLVALESEAIEGPVFVGLLLAVLASFEATSMIVRSVAKAASAMAAAERLQALTEIDPPVAETSAPVALPHDGAIAFNDVSFHYDNGVQVLCDVSLRVQPGERIAIAGPSGGGKSTLLKLLLRLVEPQSGDITIGDIPLSHFKTADVHAHCALLSQDSPVFIDTIRNNLLIGRSDATDADLWASLERAHLDSFVRSLPKGLDTVVGEAGRTLSVGQARRLCLARALVTDAPVLLLDEPTDALDRDTEEAFLETLATGTQGRTVIMVTHAAIPDGTVDRVLTLKNGRVEDAGRR